MPSESLHSKFWLRRSELEFDWRINLKESRIVAMVPAESKDAREDCTQSNESDDELQ